MLWVNFLHIYQPANSDSRHIEEATEKSYWRIVRALEEHPQIKFTMNISGCLILRWENLKYFDLLKRLAKLVERGQIELTGSAAYHPLLPLVSEKEAVRQITENEEILKKYFSVKLRGFFFPEMAYSSKMAKLVKKLGHEWIILDEISYQGKLGKTPDNQKVYLDRNSGLKIVFRSREISQSYVPETIKNLLGSDSLFITASDGELYGLRHEDPDAHLEKLLSTDIKTLTISEFIEGRAEEKISPISSSWETVEKDLKAGMPFALWRHNKNSIHKKLWQLAELAANAAEKNTKDKNYFWARWHLVRGLASCTFWWASGKDLRHVFGPVSWGPDEIERGANELVRVVRSLDNPETRKTKLKAEETYTQLRKIIWSNHWKNHWKK